MSINLGLFCCADSNLYDLSRPWKLPDGRLAATDGRIIVVCEASLYSGSRNDSGKHPTGVENLVEYTGEWSKWPAAVPVKWLKDDGRCALNLGNHWYDQLYLGRLKAALNSRTVRWAETEGRLVFDFAGGRASLMPLVDEVPSL